MFLREMLMPNRGHKLAITAKETARDIHKIMSIGATNIPM
jgi:hypothetical protein